MLTYQFTKAQVSAEFIMLVGVFTFFLVSFIGAYYLRSAHIYEDNLILDAKRLGDEIAGQINTAYLSGPGYTKNYSLPLNLSGQNYEVFIFPDRGQLELKIRQTSFFFSLITRNITNNFTKGNNLIKNVEGVIIIEK